MWSDIKQLYNQTKCLKTIPDLFLSIQFLITNLELNLACTINNFIVSKFSNIANSLEHSREISEHKEEDNEDDKEEKDMD